jgi:hypothetical protein
MILPWGEGGKEQTKGVSYGTVKSTRVYVNTMCYDKIIARRMSECRINSELKSKIDHPAPRCFTHGPIMAYNHAHRPRHLKKLSEFLEVPTDFLNHFWIQVAVLLLNRRAEFLEVKRPSRIITVSETKR